ncbi:hypothetical protein [Flavobacterium suncheonense]|uniref:DUF3592 domain-containing protein n=1 Tax=Flavobacterium suncheonense GH29-5 = DSM 17707 TaxID=1121899 RepID=A0A0A2M075_9FLAO|nr:hypothetical protein [Flavobacterium suncheonense]KGO84878.1 hypothetical protein Q764_14305 [Flavobacterium suncheonense GH29-5 = DSM 17707]
MNTEKKTREKILTNKFLPLILMALNLSFFFYLIPEHVAEANSTLLGIVGGIITMILSFWIFGILTPKLYEKIPIFMGLFCISTLFIFGYFFIVKTTDFSSNELSKNGVYTEAIIIDKTKIYGKRGNSIQNIEVQFNTNKGEQANAQILITEQEYENFYKGMKIKIYYSSEHPNIARVSYK